MRVLGFLLVALLVAGSVLAGEPESFVAKVTWVKDGDSFLYEYTTHNVSIKDECRMRYYNAPEMSGPEADRGAPAKKRLIKILMVGDRRVRIETKGTRDKYGRQLCDVYLVDGTSVTGLMREYLKGYSGLDKYKALY